MQLSPDLGSNSNDQQYSKLSSAQLRKHAEDIVLEKIKQLSEGMEPLSLEESRRLLNELQVFQIELEMQNESFAGLRKNSKHHRSLL